MPPDDEATRAPDAERSATLFGDDPVDLADILNTVLDRGAVLHGDVTIAVADVDLIKLNLALLIQAVESAVRRTGPAVGATGGDVPSPAPKSLAGSFGPILEPVARPATTTQPQRADTRPSASGSAAPTPPDGGERSTSLNDVAQGLPARINADEKGVESGLARLVLTLIEVLRKVLEHQAVRRMEGGHLSDEQIERLGLALSRLDDRMQDLKRVFGLTDEDLQIDLGPLGRLR